MKHLRFSLLLCLTLVLTAAAAQQVMQIPVDPAVRIGKLPNGLTYYLRHNALPAERANFYIAQKVGSVQEEESQRGLAHFLEHMCFNGTEHFPGNSMIAFCERIGVKFGQNLNAYTSTDETVYNIDDVPVTEENIDSCLLILHDWSGCLLLEPEEIDKERGVIHEEWRMRTSAIMRIIERQLEALYPGSKYGKRMPIGLMSVVDHFKPEELRAYYEKWYRPDLQGIIVVGDIDVDAVEKKIQTLFADLTVPENAAPYETYPVPTTPEAIYIVDKDKEMAQAAISLSFKHPLLPEEYRPTVAWLGQSYGTSVMAATFNARLAELAQDPACPFVQAGARDGKYLFSKTMGSFDVDIVPKPGKSVEALTAVVAEINRVRQHGFTASEVIRQREEYLSRLERIYENRDKQYNAFYVPQYVRHFLEQEPIPDIETEYQLTQLLAQNIPSEVFTQLFQEYTASTDSDFVCFAVYPEQDGVEVPSADALRAAVAAGLAQEVAAYVDNVKDEPLVPALPKKGQIAKTEEAPFGYTCWTLANGARVFWRQTDFNASEVRFAAQSMGGSSLLSDGDVLQGALLGSVMGSTGLGNFNSIELEKALAGKQVSCGASLTGNTEQLSGSSTPKDLRTLFELIYLRFQTPTVDEAGFGTFINTLATQLEHAEKEPMTAFQDTLRKEFYLGNPRQPALKYADLPKVSYDAIRRIYAERFATAGDFDFFFTGAFDIDSLRAFTEQYIAPLPAQKKRETWKKQHTEIEPGVRTNVFRRTMETPQAILLQLWSGKHPFTLDESVAVSALGEILTQRYLKTIREDGGMAYSVQAGANLSYGTEDTYVLQIVCPVKPEKMDSALLLIRQDIDAIAQRGVTDDELDKFKQFEAKQFADAQKKNAYWQNLIIEQTQWQQDLHTAYPQALENLTSERIQTFVRDVLLPQNNCITVGMLPENVGE